MEGEGAEALSRQGVGRSVSADHEWSCDCSVVRAIMRVA